MPVNSMPLTIGEVLQKVKEAKSKAERVEILKQNTSEPLKHFLRLAFDPTIKMSLAGGTPNYRPNPKPATFGDTTIKASIGGWYVFFEKSAPGLRAPKRNLLFLNLLESLDSQEAAFLVAAKDKKLDVGLTKKVIDEVFPGLLTKEEITKEPEKKDGGQGTEAISDS